MTDPTQEPQDNENDWYFLQDGVTQCRELPNGDALCLPQGTNKAEKDRVWESLRGAYPR